jgi:hypothetical protein
MVSSPSLSRLAAITTLIPSLASAIAVVLPIPELEPVTIATFCDIFYCYCSFFLQIILVVSGVYFG